MVSSCFVVCCFVLIVLSEPRARVGRSQTSRIPPSNFIAGRPKVTLLFWFFRDFRCGVPLFIVILVMYKYKNR